jgi:hypothetical protein
MECLPPHQLGTETDPVSEMLCSLEYWIVDEVKKTNSYSNSSFVLAFGRMWLRNTHLTDFPWLRTPVSFHFNGQWQGPQVKP